MGGHTLIVILPDVLVLTSCGKLECTVGRLTVNWLLISRIFMVDSLLGRVCVDVSVLVMLHCLVSRSRLLSLMDDLHNIWLYSTDRAG